VKMNGDPDPEFTFKLKRRIVQNEDGTFGLVKHEKSAHDVRDRIFAISKPDSTPEQALAFFQEFGPFMVNEKLEGLPIRFSWFKQKLEAYEAALLNKNYWDESGDPDDLEDAVWFLYLRQPLQAEIRKGVRALSECLVVVCKDVNECLRATVFLDSLTGPGRGRCENLACSKIFQKTRKKRRFCSRKCEELIKKRNQRKKAKEAAQKKQAKKGRKKVIQHGAL
jgi:hypothetical protein